MSCNYLPGHTEQLQVVTEPIGLVQYQSLLQQGFRRSGGQVYRPHCPSCQSCVPTRIPVNQFHASRSQRRLQNKNHDLHWQIRYQVQTDYYPLYFNYINARHWDGNMFPPSKEQFDRFIPCHWLETLYLEAWLNDQLILVAATDQLPNALSAVYTFFDPNLANRSLGTRAILAQIALAQSLGKDHLYLGYQVDRCQKMEYKKSYRPYERLTSHGWQLQR